jgi:hypothetical protein
MFTSDFVGVIGYVRFSCVICNWYSCLIFVNNLRMLACVVKYQKLSVVIVYCVLNLYYTLITRNSGGKTFATSAIPLQLLAHLFSGNIYVSCCIMVVILQLSGNFFAHYEVIRLL